MANDPVELDPEIDAELVIDDEDDEDDDLADGFVVEGEDDDDDVPVGSDDDDDEAVGDVDEGSTIAIIIAAEDPDEFEEDVSPVAPVLEDEEDAQGRQAGEFICTRCFLVKKDSQMAVRSRKVCRDCA